MLTLFILFGLYFHETKSKTISIKQIKKILILFYEISFYDKLLCIALFFLIFFNFIEALSPPLVIDDLKYHFAIPKRYMIAGEIDFVPDFSWSNLPWTMEMIWTLAIGLDSGILAQLVNFSIGLICLLWILKFCTVLNLNFNYTLISITLWYSISTVSNISSSGLVELGATMFFASAMYLIFELKSYDNLRMIFLIGILLGLFTTTKIPNAIFLLFFSIYFCLLIFTYESSIKDKITRIFTFGFACLLGPIVWFIKSIYFTGNPVYPFLINYLGGVESNTQLLGGAVPGFWNFSNYHKFNFPEFPLCYLYQLYLMIADPQLLRGHISPLFVSLLPFVILDYAKTRKGQLVNIYVVLGLFYIYWVSFYPNIRVGLPLLLIISVFISNSIKNLNFAYALPKKLIEICLLIFMVPAIYSSSVNYKHQFSFLSGKSKKNEYLQKVGSLPKFNFRSYPAFSFMNNNIKDDALILLWSNDGYYLNKNYLYALEFITRMSKSKKLLSKNSVIDELKSYGITHVAMTSNHLRLPLRRALESTKVLKTIYEDKYMVVKELPF